MRRSKVIYIADRSGHKPVAGEVNWLRESMVRPGKKPLEIAVRFSQSWQSPSKTAKVRPAWQWNMLEPMPRNMKPAHPMVRVVDPDEEEETCDDTSCPQHWWF